MSVQNILSLVKQGIWKNDILSKLFQPALTNKLSTDKQYIPCFFFIKLGHYMHFAKPLGS